MAAQPHDLPFNVIDLQPSVTFTLVDVTPEIAERLLERNVNNRRIRQSVVDLYARDMAAGRWKITGEAISLDRVGNLINGQHRLLAVIKSGATVQLTVARNLDSDVQDVMDTGAKRLSSDQLAMHGHHHAVLIAAGVRHILQYESGRPVTSSKAPNVTHSEILSYVEQHDDLADWAALAARMRSHVDMQPGLLLASVWILSRVDAEAAVEFFERLADGVDLKSGSPILALRSRLRQMKSTRSRVHPGVYLSLTFRAWNAWRAGSLVRSLPTHRNGQVVTCPEPK